MFSKTANGILFSAVGEAKTSGSAHFPFTGRSGHIGGGQFYGYGLKKSKIVILELLVNLDVKNTSNLIPIPNLRPVFKDNH